MSKNDKIYRIISLINFWLHIGVFVFVIAVGFLPFKENENFYEYFGNNSVDSYKSYFIIALLFLSCLAAFITIKHPLCSFIVLPLSFFAFFIIVFPYCLDAMIIGLVQHGGEIDMSMYKTGYRLMEIASYVSYFEIAFLIYSIVVFFIRLNEKYDNI